MIKKSHGPGKCEINDVSSRTLFGENKHIEEKTERRKEKWLREKNHRGVPVCVPVGLSKRYRGVPLCVYSSGPIKQ